jgi:Ca2+-binding RTX toxin-like protein
VIDAGGGNDIVFAGSGNDAIDSGGGIDTIYAGAGDDTITDGNWYFGGDIFDGGAGVDTLIVRFDWFDGVQYNLASGWMRYPGPGGTTFDTILNIENLVVGGGADVIGSSAANVITILDLGFDHNNVIDAGDGNDIVFAGIGNDIVNGGLGDDTLYGGAGIDVLKGGAGIDVLSGNTDDDDFVYTSTADSNEATGLDSIVALEEGDQLDFSALLLATDKTAILNRGNVAYLGSTLDFFNDGGIDRAVAVQTDGATTRAYADSNADGNYTIGLDLAIQFTGNVLPALTGTSDYIF